MTPISEGQEKREKLATRLESVNVSIDPNWRIGTVDPDYEADREAIAAAAAELRKACLGCAWWLPLIGSRHDCNRTNGPIRMPEDGSGFCSRWDPRPDTTTSAASPQEGAQ